MYQYITTKNIIFPDPKKYNIYLSDEAKDLIRKVLFPGLCELILVVALQKSSRQNWKPK